MSYKITFNNELEAFFKCFDAKTKTSNQIKKSSKLKSFWNWWDAI